MTNSTRSFFWFSFLLSVAGCDPVDHGSIAEDFRFGGLPSAIPRGAPESKIEVLELDEVEDADATALDGVCYAEYEGEPCDKQATCCQSGLILDTCHCQALDGNRYPRLLQSDLSYRSAPICLDGDGGSCADACEDHAYPPMPSFEAAQAACQNVCLAQGTIYRGTTRDVAQPPEQWTCGCEDCDDWVIAEEVVDPID